MNTNFLKLWVIDMTQSKIMGYKLKARKLKMFLKFAVTILRNKLKTNRPRQTK